MIWLDRLLPFDVDDAMGLATMTARPGVPIGLPDEESAVTAAAQGFLAGI